MGISKLSGRPVYGFGYDEHQPEGSVLTIDEMQTAAVIFMTMIRGMKMTGAAGKIMRMILTGCYYDES